MALKQATDRATIAQLILGAGVASFAMALTFRKLRGGCQHRDKKGKASLRSEQLTKGSTPEHIVEHIARLEDPDYVCLSIAENKLTVGPLVEKLFELDGARLKSPPPQDPRTPHGLGGNCKEGNSGFDAEHKAEPTPAAASPDETVDGKTGTAKEEASRLDSLGYGDPRGPLWVRRQIAGLMEKRMFHREVDPERLCIAAGAKTVLRLLMVTLTERGQGCLIPAPYFPGFDEALVSAGVRAWAARDASVGGAMMEAGADAGISPRVLEASFREARSAGVDVRVILITSPHNPTGRLYSAKALTAAIAWARKRELHVVVDEVYANSVHRPHATFRSVGSLAADGCPMGDDVHLVYGLSKDFGVAGWRMGVLYSENKEVVSTLTKMVRTTSQASSDTMDKVGRLFRSPGFLEGYIAQHQEGLRAAYMSLVNELGRRGIMHLQAEAGLFAMVDLREFLEDSSKEAEARLWREILDRTGVNLTPGGALHCADPGWFRLCFAYQKIDVVSRAVTRMADFLQNQLFSERAARLAALLLQVEEVVAPEGLADVVVAPAVAAAAAPTEASVAENVDASASEGATGGVEGEGMRGEREKRQGDAIRPDGGDERPCEGEEG
ncbi:unnamed protein product, partial [Ascophyllum nodosum]